MGPIGSIFRVMSHPFTYSGRARFSEYWWFAGLSYLAYIAFSVWFYTRLPWDEIFVAAALGEAEFETWAQTKLLEAGAFEWAEWAMTTVTGWAAIVVYVVFSIWHYLAWCAVGVRRLHDTGRGAGLYLLIYVWSYALYFLVAFGFGFLAATGGRDALAVFGGILMIINIVSIPLSIIFLVAMIWYFIVMFFPGDPGRNKFGPGHGPGGESIAQQAAAWAPPETVQAPAMTADDLRALRASRMNS